MSDGFLSRWSRRKAGKQEDVIEQKKEVPQPPVQTHEEISAPDSEETLTVSLDDVEKIDRFSPDFSAFMKPDVDPAVQQAALKKMFTDPHFNVMDGLDIYIDDYSKPDPLPAGMLERMVQSDLLGLFSKTSEVVEHDPKQSESPAVAPQLQNEVIGVQMQSDLTSSQQKPSAQLDEASIEPEQKKT